MKKAILGACVVLTALMTAQSASADLVDNGGGLIYDTVKDITWLADPNAGFGTTFDAADGRVDGRLTWANALAWTASLTTGGFTGWRLPHADDLITPPGGVPCLDLACDNTEFGQLFYGGLGGVAQTDINHTNNGSLALFTPTGGFQTQYWTSTSFIKTAPDPGEPADANAYTFGMINGVDPATGIPFPLSPVGITDPLILDNMEAGIFTDTFKGDSRGAWAVHDGNIGGVAQPLPDDGNPTPLSVAAWLILLLP